MASVVYSECALVKDFRRAQRQRRARRDVECDMLAAAVTADAATEAGCEEDATSPSEGLRLVHFGGTAGARGRDGLVTRSLLDCPRPRSSRLLYRRPA